MKLPGRDRRIDVAIAKSQNPAMERDLPDASNPRGRLNVKFGVLSILCFLGGFGVLFLFASVADGIGTGPVADFVAKTGFVLRDLFWAVGLVCGVLGLVRHEQPFLALLGLVAAAGIIVLQLEPFFVLHARGKRPRSQCVSNEKQILLAMAMYADSNGGRLPVDSSTNPTLVGSLQLLSNVVGSATIFHCPEDRRPRARPEREFKKLTTLNISYSYVPNLKWQDVPDSPVILDRIYSTTNGSAWPSDGNHRGQGGIVGFRDGHVQWCPVLPAALKDDSGRQVVLSP